MTTEKSTNKSINWPLVIVGLAVMVAGALVAHYALGPRQSASLPEDLQATYLPQGKPISGLQLSDHNQAVFDESRFKDKWSFLFFGFTNCPDICPTTMLVMKSVWNKLPEAAKQSPAPQMIFVSVDPQRDTLDKLQKYVTFYHPDFLGVTGELDQIDMLTKQLGVLYGFEDPTEDGNYTVNHSSQIILVDPQGNMRAVFSSPHLVDEIVRSFASIRNYYNG